MSILNKWTYDATTLNFWAMVPVARVSLLLLSWFAHVKFPSHAWYLLLFYYWCGVCYLCDLSNVKCRCLTKYQRSRHYIATVRAQVILLLVLLHCNVTVMGFAVECAILLLSLLLLSLLLWHCDNFVTQKLYRTKNLF